MLDQSWLWLCNDRMTRGRSSFSRIRVCCPYPCCCRKCKVQWRLLLVLRRRFPARWWIEGATLICDLALHQRRWCQFCSYNGSETWCSIPLFSGDMVAGSQTAMVMEGEEKIRVRVSCVKWRRWWRGKLSLVNLVSEGLWHVSAYGWPDLKGGDCHMATSGWMEFKW